MGIASKSIRATQASVGGKNTRHVRLGFVRALSEDAGIVVHRMNNDEWGELMIGVDSRNRFGLMVWLSFFSAAFLSTIWLSPASAAGAPAQLYNKTIDIFWGENTSNKRIADGVVVNTAGRLQLLVYISSAGRPFVRFTGGSNYHSHTGEFGPEVAGGHVNFSGNTLVMAAASKTGVARRITVTFDSGFAGCTASVMGGKTGASPTWKGFDGAPYELLTINVGSATCSIKEGNAVGH
jgi:hypothetical protein